MSFDLAQLNEEIKRESQFIELLESEISKVIVGQQYLVRRLLVGLLANGHILLEGVPGLAKTLTVHSLAQLIQTQFQRIQFTPDLLPADLLGTLIYNQKDGEFTIKKGPLFSNIILADEINRSPAKVQAALLEAMQERQITIGEETFKLHDPFLVLATQNPIEQEGTYPLPEAQVDRFMLKVKINYPNETEELEIIRRMAHPRPNLTLQPVVNPEQILKARQVVDSIYMDEKIERYIVDIVFATRNPEKYGLGELTDLIQFGASPRASINLAMTAKAHAFINHRGYVTPDDIRAMGMDVLRHRVLVTYEAEAENMTSEDIIQRVFETVEVP
ncbi:MAG: MoxR family ATPase [Candidatus Marinimicrobia bacterium]|nr:MoxR family ATPase [Candidatus Neomarinimicrobiota bacterium]MCF7839373.1 MoxR family ATPase [Candidatus Neomarinimicrobiota bacterium]MCF7903244.1 MoxR family ATPase [Candidatus Neomarinimicrobiota bacterium]